MRLTCPVQDGPQKDMMHADRPQYLSPAHPRVGRREMLQAGAIGLLGLGTNHLAALRTAIAAPAPKAQRVIYIFLSGGLAQQDSFDLKPAAPDEVRGEFKPIRTATPGLSICEHLPMLAERSDRWALVRSLTHPYNEHSDGHLAMLTGRSVMPPGFDRNQPKRTDWPSIASLASVATRPTNNLPPAVVLPERLVHRTGRVIPGQFSGEMGPRREAWFVEASPFDAEGYGAYPEYAFHHEKGRLDRSKQIFQAPRLSLPEGVTKGRLLRRTELLSELNRQRRALDAAARVEQFDQHREQALSMLTDAQVHRAFDLAGASDKELDRYGRNSFGWSLLMARRLVESGVNLVQVNLGNNETWDTHQAAFPNLKNFLFPPTDRAVSALLDDLADRGLLATTLLVMAGEFGRTPKVFNLPKAKLPGRDHWGAVQSVWLAGAGFGGGSVIGASDRVGAYPAADPQRPENLAATIYQALGIPATAVWKDDLDRPHPIYYGDPFRI